MSILRKLLKVPEKKPDVPATQEEIDQLKLEVEKAELNAKLVAARQKSKPQGGLRETMEKVLGKPTYDIFDVKNKTDNNLFR